MSKAMVHSTLCGFEHVIHGKREGKVITIDIDTPCEKIQKMSHMEFGRRETMDMRIKDNPVMEKAQEFQCSNTCLVPCGIMHILRIEAGLLTETLCKQKGGVSITFGDD